MSIVSDHSASGRQAAPAPTQGQRLRLSWTMDLTLTSTSEQIAILCSARLIGLNVDSERREHDPYWVPASVLCALFYLYYTYV